MAGRIIAFSDNGRRIGEGHPQAKLKDEDIDLIFALREEGLSLSAIAEKFDVQKPAIWKILKGLRRADTPAEWRPAGTLNPKVQRTKPVQVTPPGKDTPGSLLQRHLTEAWR